MKLKFFKCITLMLIGGFVLSSCNEQKYNSIDNGLYIEEAAPLDKFNQQVETQLIDDLDVLKTLTVRLIQGIDEDITVTLDVDPQLIEKYNKAHNTVYQVLPQEYWSFEKNVKIVAGEVFAPVVNVRIKPFIAPNNESYALPIRIVSVDGPVSLVGNADHILYLLTVPNKQKSIVLSAGETSTTFKTKFPTDAWTIEYWVRVNNITGQPTDNWEGEANATLRGEIFKGNSSPVNLSGEGSGLLLRYYPSGVTKTAPTLQCQMNGSYFGSSEFWRPDIWYHIAYTFDGHNVQLYKDGSPDRSGVSDKKFTFTKLLLCSSMVRSMQVELAQIRLWNKCLSQSAIQDGMSRQLPADTEGLLGYWMCNEGEGNVLKDCTINGNDIIIDSQTPKWSEHIYNFSHPNN